MSFAAQILGNRYAALAHEGATGFAAMSRTPLVIEEGQYACAILDANGRLIAQDQGEPSHLAAVQATVAYSLDAFAFNLAEGDVILAGDPYCGGTWGGVLTVIVPVFWDGDVQFLTAVRFAAADLAGNVPGPYQPDAHEIWQESLRVSPVKLVKAGAPQKDVRRYIVRNTRATELLDSDLTTAVVTASRIADEVTRLIDDKGLALALEAAEHCIAYGAQRAASVLKEITSGHGTCAGVAAEVQQGEVLTVAFQGSAASGEDAMNMTAVTTKAVVLSQLLSEVIDDAGMSQGVLDAVNITSEPGTVVNASFPAALSCGWRVVAPAVSQALAQATGQNAAFQPAPPMVMLFNEIGAGPVTVPMALSPAFTPIGDCAGSDTASGRRKIISAEEAEVTGRVMLHQREISKGGIMAAVTVTAEDQEAIILPGGTPPKIDGATQRERSNVVSLPEESMLIFTYPEGAS